MAISCKGQLDATMLRSTLGRGASDRLQLDRLRVGAPVWAPRPGAGGVVRGGGGRGGRGGASQGGGGGGGGGGVRSFWGEFIGSKPPPRRLAFTRYSFSTKPLYTNQYYYS